VVNGEWPRMRKNSSNDIIRFCLSLNSRIIIRLGLDFTTDKRFAWLCVLWE
jgi:hypothetical protein